MRRREWNVGTASKSNVCNCQCNPCKITQQRWYVCNCVCETRSFLAYLFIKLVCLSKSYLSFKLVNQPFRSVISLLCASTGRQTRCFLSYISIFWMLDLIPVMTSFTFTACLNWSFKWCLSGGQSRVKYHIIRTSGSQKLGCISRQFLHKTDNSWHPLHRIMFFFTTIIHLLPVLLGDL